VPFSSGPLNQEMKVIEELQRRRCACDCAARAMSAPRGHHGVREFRPHP
jgi:hypothetical protein